MASTYTMTAPTNPHIITLRSPPARECVLHTVELLENILLSLPVRDLLSAQRVSRTWHDVINASVTLQRAVFLSPEKYPFEVGKGLQRPSHPPASTRTPAAPIHGSHPSRTAPPPQTYSDLHPTHLHANPLLHSLFSVYTRIYRGPDGPYMYLELTRSARELAKNPAFRYPEASWRRMFLTQPPIKWVEVDEGFNDGGADEALGFTARDEGGVRLEGVWSPR